MWGPSNILFKGYRGAFPVVKRLDRAVHHSRINSAEVKKKWSFTSAPPIYCHALEKETPPLCVC